MASYRTRCCPYGAAFNVGWALNAILQIGSDGIAKEVFPFQIQTLSHSPEHPHSRPGDLFPGGGEFRDVRPQLGRVGLQASKSSPHELRESRPEFSHLMGVLTPHVIEATCQFDDLHSAKTRSAFQHYLDSLNADRNGSHPRLSLGHQLAVQAKRGLWHSLQPGWINRLSTTLANAIRAILCLSQRILN